jgi:hypothetical protein
MKSQSNQTIKIIDGFRQRLDHYPPDTLISRSTAADGLGLRTSTLANWASIGRNTDVLTPVKLGQHTVRYRAGQVAAIQRLGIPGARSDLERYSDGLV